jgi:N-methylhydantoinase B
VAHTVGAEEPESVGIYGGYPASTNGFVIIRDSNVADLLASGKTPGSLDDLQGRTEVQPGLADTYLNKGDVFRSIVSGGGGYGDPLEREPALVLSDVQHGLVSVQSAADQYGVVLSADVRAVNVEATRARREALRAARRQGEGGADGAH